jgi:predicted negative regulator of RcsB-dependent stress response
VSVAAIAELQGYAISTGITSWRRVLFLCALADLCLNSGHANEGLQVVQLIAEADRGNIAAPEILRLEGELLLKQGKSSVAEATRRFHEAIDVARSREAKSFELRAAMSLARLLAQQGRREEAHAALAGVYGWFTEGFDTADLKTAKSLLETLT